MTTPAHATFGSWLRRQSDRGDPVGDLARDFRADRGSTRVTTPEALRRRMDSLGACPLALKALDRATSEWAARAVAADLCEWRVGPGCDDRCHRPTVLRVHRRHDTDLPLCTEHLTTCLLAYGAATVVPAWQTTHPTSSEDTP